MTNFGGKIGHRFINAIYDPIEIQKKCKIYKLEDILWQVLFSGVDLIRTFNLRPAIYNQGDTFTGATFQ